METCECGDEKKICKHIPGFYSEMKREELKICFNCAEEKYPDILLYSNCIYCIFDGSSNYSNDILLGAQDFYQRGYDHSYKYKYPLYKPLKCNEIHYYSRGLYDFFKLGYKAGENALKLEELI